MNLLCISILWTIVLLHLGGGSSLPKRPNFVDGRKPPVRPKIHSQLSCPSFCDLDTFSFQRLLLALRSLCSGTTRRNGSCGAQDTLPRNGRVCVRWQKLQS